MRLAVILVQYARRKYPLALRRLVEQTNAWSQAQTTLVVVDNLLPGDWYHEVSPDLFHLGGDNSAWEFSAFDRGLRFLKERRREADLYAFVTDAFTAYGDDFLELLDEHVLDYTLELQSCSGWVDSIFQPFKAFSYEYVQYLRTSFLITTPQVLDTLGPLATPIQPEALFSGNPAAPFRSDAPLSRNLQDFLLTWLTGAESSVELERVWHSRFDLNADTLPLFEAKTLAIMREHLLSARLLSQGTPCFDFRLLAKLADRQVSPHQISRENRRRWQWLHWRDSSIDFEPRFFIEACDIPEAIMHGDRARAELRGWVVTEPQVPEVYLQLAPDRRYPVSCNYPRHDELPGFEISLELQHVPPGSYDVEWVIPTTKPSHHRIGSLRVLPCHRFELERIYIPEMAIDQVIPISLQGQFLSTHALKSVKAHWNGEPLDLNIVIHRQPRSKDGLHIYSIRCYDTFQMEQRKEQHQLSLIFLTTDGATHTWHRNALVSSGDTPSHQVALRRIGPFDAASGLTEVQLQGLVFTDCPRAYVQLLHDGRTILDIPLTPIDGEPAEGQHALCRFDLRRQLAGLPPGTWGFELVLKEHTGQPTKKLQAWHDTIGLLEPLIHVDEVALEPIPNRRNHHVLRLVGWIENDFIVDYLDLHVDDGQVGVFGLNQLRPDAAKETKQTLVRRQGFHIERRIELAPGTHELRLTTGQVDGACGIWQQQLQVAEAIPDRFQLESEAIEELIARKPSHYWSAIQLDGKVTSELPAVIASLYVDGINVDQHPLQEDGTFVLRHVPTESGEALIRVLIKSGRSVLYDSGTVTAQLEKLDIPPDMPAILRTLATYFEIRDPWLQDDPHAACRGLLERNLEDLPSFLSRLRGLGAVVERAQSNREGGFVDIEQQAPPPLPEGPLRILFACWEVPSLRHGGGVCMSNLLKGLSQQHQVTVLHPFSLEESGWVEDVRPFVHKIISVPREHRHVTYRHDRGIPEHFFANYVPSLRQAIESELATGQYDVVNYEYCTMFTHISRAAVPKVLVVHELGFRAKLTTYFDDNQSLDESLDELQDLLETLYFYTEALPTECSHLIALTEEDGRSLGRLLGPETPVYVNTIGVDDGRFERPPAEDGEPPSPTLVFLGNYRHPPNVHAAKFYAEEVMPKVAQRHPEAKFLIIGSHVPPELEEAAQHPNIEITGFVDDFRPYLWNATAFVAPIFVGAGMRVKILEAMACGCPILSTELGMNGLGGDRDTHFMQAETATDFIEATCRLIEQPDLGQSLGQAARQLIEAKHSWRQKVGEREAVWGHVLAAAADPGLSFSKPSDAELPKQSTPQPDHGMTSKSKKKTQALS